MCGLASELDFEVAAYLLYPQLEHALREVFFQRGVVTMKNEGRKGQDEYDINKLLNLPEAKEILFPEIVLDFQALLTERGGANLRNNLAHGLIDDGSARPAMIYLWWWCLRLVLCPWLPRPKQ